MKRKEMLDEITFILDTEWDLNHPSKSELILTKLEKLGMLPPLIEVEIECNKGFRTFKRNQWESEDD